MAGNDAIQQSEIKNLSFSSILSMKVFLLL